MNQLKPSDSAENISGRKNKIWACFSAWSPVVRDAGDKNNEMSSEIREKYKHLEQA